MRSKNYLTFFSRSETSVWLVFCTYIKRVIPRSTESRGYPPDTPISSHKESNGLGFIANSESKITKCGALPLECLSMNQSYLGVKIGKMCRALESRLVSLVLKDEETALTYWPTIKPP